MAVLKKFSYDNIVEHNPTAPDPVEGGGGGAGVFHAYFIDDSGYVCDEAGHRLQFDDLVKQDPTELPVFVMAKPLYTLFFYLVYMESDSARILSADGSSTSTSKIIKESATGYAKMRTAPT